MQTWHTCQYSTGKISSCSSFLRLSWILSNLIRQNLQEHKRAEGASRFTEVQINQDYLSARAHPLRHLSIAVPRMAVKDP